VTEHVRVAVVGSGFGGIGASVALAEAGIDHVVLERADDVGGTWRDNRYPGCRCDVPSHLYSFSFAPNPEWSETYSPQPEIQAYLRRVAEERGVVARTRFGHEVRSARWDADRQHWALDTAAGPLTADALILGNGPLAEPAVPDIPGLDSFAGPRWHTAAWPAEADLAGKRVAVIGTGASAIQLIPAIADEVAHLTVFQRTPPWIIPHSNRSISSTERALYRRLPRAQRAVREAVYWSREAYVTGYLRNGRLLERVEAIARRHLREQVPDPELRRKLTPDYRPGCKRLLLSDDYYPALTRPDVDLVTEKIVEVRPHGVVTADGTEHPVDVIVLGTGFRVTDNPIAERVHGRERTLAEAWTADGMRAYLGTSVPGFPNLFLLAGPNTGIGHTSLVVMIEAQLEHITSALVHMERYGAATAEVRRPVVEAYNAEVQGKASRTVWNAGGCASWYLDAEGRNTTLWPDYTFRFRRLTRRFEPTAYELTAPLVRDRETA
jgi:cation diffusion facilitator CzcD-associated flavoprotein CzcO